MCFLFGKTRKHCENNVSALNVSENMIPRLATALCLVLDREHGPYNLQLILL